MGNMVLKVATNKVGSECERDLGITKEEWDAMSEDQQHDVMNEIMWEVLDVWVDEED